MPEGPREQVDLLITDSLDRPLAKAHYSLHPSGSDWSNTLTGEGQLDADGRVSLRWREEGLTVVVGHRALVLSRGPLEGPLHTRNCLTSLGFDTGPPESAIDTKRVELSLEALVDCARARLGNAVASLTPQDLLTGWVRGEIGVAEPAVPLPTPTKRRRFRRPKRRGGEQGIPAGTHLGPDDLTHLCRTVSLAVTPRFEDGATATNRIVVYDWFTGYGCPPRAGNAIIALIDGEAAWGATARDIEAASDELCVTSWSIDPDIELVRPAELAKEEPAARRRYRFASYVEALASRGGRSTVLVWNWVGTPLLNPTLRRWAIQAGDNVEVLQRAHPRFTGSFHQKTVVIDRRVAYCGGLNLRQNDWDTQAHTIDDARRHPHDASSADRHLPLPAFGPRHDMAVRIEGPLVRDLHDNFRDHWNSALDAQLKRHDRPFGRAVARMRGTGPSGPVDTMTSPPEPRGQVVAQLVRTDPDRHPKEQAIYDMLLRAIHNANKLIYIENQYFRSEPILHALVNSLRKHRQLELVVVTNKVDPPWRWAHGGAFYTEQMQREIRSLRPHFHLYELLSCSGENEAVTYQPIDVHAKVMIVDDVWATVGSANLNERSIRSEAEANVAIDDWKFASNLRRDLMAEHLGLERSDPRLGSTNEVAALWRNLAQKNAVAREQNRRATGHAHPFEQEPSLRMLRGRSSWF